VSALAGLAAFAGFGALAVAWQVTVHRIAARWIDR
jgi:hypothetical protein